jgi:hypothetical protein
MQKDTTIRGLALYGFCPQCGAKGKKRERRPNGDDTCENGHVYPSLKAADLPYEAKQISVEAEFYAFRSLAQIADYPGEDLTTKQRGAVRDMQNLQWRSGARHWRVTEVDSGVVVEGWPVKPALPFVEAEFHELVTHAQQAAQ